MPLKRAVKIARVPGVRLNGTANGFPVLTRSMKMLEEQMPGSSGNLYEKDTPWNLKRLWGWKSMPS